MKEMLGWYSLIIIIIVYSIVLIDKDFDFDAKDHATLVFVPTLIYIFYTLFYE